MLSLSNTNSYFVKNPEMFSKSRINAQQTLWSNDSLQAVIELLHHHTYTNTHTHTNL